MRFEQLDRAQVAIDRAATWLAGPCPRLTERCRVLLRASIIRLIGALLAEQHDEWVLARDQAVDTAAEEVNAAPDLQVLTA